MKRSQRNADLRTLAYTTLQSIAWKWKKCFHHICMRWKCSNKKSFMMFQNSHFFCLNFMLQGNCMQTAYWNVDGRKTISCEESKHAPFFFWLIYIVYIYKQQNLHFPTTFISIDTTPWCPIYIKSFDRILFKNVRAHCYCASLQRTQIHMARHASSGRAKY